MKVKIERSELLRHLRACKALGCPEIRLTGMANAIRLQCGTPSLASSIPAVCDSEEACLIDEAGIKALIGTLASLPDESVDLDVDARIIGIQAERRRITVDTYPEAEDTAQIPLMPRAVP